MEFVALVLSVLSEISAVNCKQPQVSLSISLSGLLDLKIDSTFRHFLNWKFPCKNNTTNSITIKFQPLHARTVRQLSQFATTVFVGSATLAPLEMFAV